jgi:hypothetical protein
MGPIVLEISVRPSWTGRVSETLACHMVQGGKREGNKVLLWDLDQELAIEVLAYTAESCKRALQLV